MAEVYSGAAALASKPVFGGEGRVEVTLGMPEAALEELRKIAGGGDLAGTFSRAIALYRLSVEAIREGKHVGIADDADKLESEFVGL